MLTPLIRLATSHLHKAELIPSQNDYPLFSCLAASAFLQLLHPQLFLIGNLTFWLMSVCHNFFKEGNYCLDQDQELNPDFQFCAWCVTTAPPRQIEWARREFLSCLWKYSHLFVRRFQISRSVPSFSLLSKCLAQPLACSSIVLIFLP